MAAVSALTDYSFLQLEMNDINVRIDPRLDPDERIGVGFVLHARAVVPPKNN
jgi:hypothetical protein